MFKKNMGIYKLLVTYLIFLVVASFGFFFVHSALLNIRTGELSREKIIEFAKETEKALLKRQVRGLHETISRRINEFNHSIKNDISDYSRSLEEIINESKDDNSSLKSFLSYLEHHEKYEYLIYKTSDLDKSFLESKENLRIDKQTLFKIRNQAKLYPNRKYIDISKKDVRNLKNETFNYLTCINHIKKGEYILILFKKIDYITEALKNIIKLSLAGRKFGNKDNGYIVILIEDGQILSYPYDEKGKVLIKFNENEVNFYLQAVKDKKSEYFEYKDKNFKEIKCSFVKKYKGILPKDIIIVATLIESVERAEIFSLISKLERVNIYYNLWAIFFYVLFTFLVIIVSHFVFKRIKNEFSNFYNKVKNLMSKLIPIDDSSFALKEIRELIPYLNDTLARKISLQEKLDIIDETINRHIYNLVFIIDKNKKINQTLGNPISILGKTREEILNKELAQILPNDIVEDINDLIVTNREKDDRVSNKILKYTKINGLKVYLSINIQKIYLNNNLFIFVYIKNISTNLVLENIIKDISKEYRILFNASTDLILINKMDLQTFSTNLFMLNEVALTKLGFKEEELIGINFNHILNKEDLKEHENLIKDLAMGSTISFNVGIKRKNGEYFPAYVRGIPFELEDFHAVMFIIKDLTYEKLLENQFNESKGKLKSLFISTPAISLVIDLKEGGKIIKANKAAVDFYGFSEKELLKLNINYLTIQSETESSFPFTIKVGTEKTQHKTKEGLIKDVIVYFTPLNTDSSIMVLVVHDLSQINIEKRNLFFQKNVLKDILNYEEDIIFYLDNSLKYIGVNKAFEEYFKLNGESLVGVNYESLIPGENNENTEIIKSNKSITYEKWLVGKENIRRLFRVLKHPILNEKNNTIALLFILKDITSTRIMEEELKKAKSEIEPTNIFKGNLLANLSHEIRTPLNGIIGIANMLLDTKLSNEQTKFLDIITRSSNSLLKIVNDILDISQIESGKYKINDSKFLLKEVIAEICEIFKPQIIKKDLKLSYNIASDIPEHLIGDAYKLRQILLNLVGNSIKFTDKGTIDIDVNIIEVLEKDENEYIVLKFSISDTGIGIKEKDKGKLFKPFSQANYDSNVNGTGLGLVITKKLVELLGGLIEVSSTYGKGSIFNFSIKLKKINILSRIFNKVAITGDISKEGKDLAIQLSNDSGAELTVFNSTENFDYKKEFQLVIIVSNNQLEKYLEKNSTNISKIKGLKVLIAKETISDKEYKLIEKSKITSVILKPNSISETNSVLKQLALEKNITFKVWDFSQIKRKERIILLEDNEINSIIICDLIKKAGFEIAAYSTTQAALDKEDFRNVDLILGDINMPDINGIETASIIRKITEDFEKYIPIIAITAYALPGDKEKCLKAGMDDYITKPINKDILYEKVEKHLKERFKKNQIVNEEIIEDSFNKNYDLILKVIKIVQDSVPKKLENLKKAAKENNFKEIEFIAHNFKGTVGSIKPQGVIEILEKLENAARLKHAENYFEIIDKLEKKLNLLLLALKNIENKIKERK